MHVCSAVLVVADARCATETEMLSSLPLQMCMYFHVYFSPLWFLGSLLSASIQVRYGVLLRLLQSGGPGCAEQAGYFFGGNVDAGLYMAAAVLNAPRLYIGYAGNLHERVRLSCIKIHLSD